jgi:hypothetical protein
MKPAIRGAYTGETYRACPSRVERHLFLGRGKGERDLKASVLTEHEAQLLGGAKTVGMGGAEGRTRTRVRDGTEPMLVEEAVLAACLHRPCASVSHTLVRSLLWFETQRGGLVIKPSSPPSRNPLSRKTHELLFPSCFPANSGNFDLPGGNHPHFP